MAEFIQENEGAFSSREFFVPGDFFQDLFVGDLWIENQRELEFFQQGYDSRTGGGIQSRELFGEEEGGAGSEGDGFSVEELAIRNGGLDGVADGVAEVEEGTGAGGFLFVFFDDAGLDRDVAGDEFGGDVLIVGVEGFELVEHRGISNCGMFDDFGEAFTEFSGSESGESFWIGEDEAGLVEGTDEVFAFGSIDPGFFPPTAESTWATMVVGIWTKGMPR